MLVVENLTKRFGGNVAVDNASFTVDRPIMLGIIGRSGAGKSTFLRMMNRLTDATTGSLNAGPGRGDHRTRTGRAEAARRTVAGVNRLVPGEVTD